MGNVFTVSYMKTAIRKVLQWHSENHWKSYSELQQTIAFKVHHVSVGLCESGFRVKEYFLKTFMEHHFPSAKEARCTIYTSFLVCITASCLQPRAKLDVWV